MNFRKKKFAVSMLTVLVMVFTMLPATAFASTGTKVKEATILFSAATEDGFDMLPTELTVTSDLTEKYYKNVTCEPEGEVTVSDAIVAAHIEVYGSKFTKNPTAYYDVEDGSFNSGYATKQFKNQYVGLYYVNGEAISTGVCKDTLEDEDILEVGSYGDDSYTNVYSEFDEIYYETQAGKTISVQLFADTYKSDFVPVRNAKIKTIAAARYTAVKDETVGTTDSNGVAKIKINEPGAYFISADGAVDYESYTGETISGKIISPYAVVMVNTPTVTSVKATSTGMSSIKVTWAKATGADKYQVYRAESKNGTYKRILTTKGTTCNNTKNIVTGKTYYYKVRAIATYEDEDAGIIELKGNFSKVISGKAKVPTPVMNAKGAKKSVNVSWKTVKGADGYEIYRGKTQNGDYTKIRTASKASTTYKSVNLKTGKSYYYKMRAYKVVNGKKVYSSFSTPKKVTVK